MLFPVLLMLFALAMERVEHRLDRLTVREQDVREFLEGAGRSEITALTTPVRSESRVSFEQRDAPAGSALAS